MSRGIRWRVLERRRWRRLLLSGMVAVACTPLAVRGQTTSDTGAVTWRALSGDPDGNACGVTSRGLVACWTTRPADPSGPRDWVGVGSPRRPRVIPALDHAVGVDVTDSFACAWRTIGDVWCWGANEFGQLGDGTLETRSRPKPIRSSVRAEYVGVSPDGFACLLSSEGEAYCWGSDHDGQLGQLHASDSLTVPTLVAGEHRFRSLSVGGDSHVCGIDLEAAIWCWGENEFGQFGVPARGKNVLAPIQVDPVRRFTTVSVGNSFTCAIEAGGSVWCWGYNRDGSLGVGDTLDYVGLQPVQGLGHVALINAGFRRPCAVTVSLELECWGLNDDRKLGATPERVTRPMTIGRLSSAPVALGPETACILDRAGTIQCWLPRRIEVVPPPSRP